MYRELTESMKCTNLFRPQTAPEAFFSRPFLFWVEALKGHHNVLFSLLLLFQGQRRAWERNLIFSELLPGIYVSYLILTSALPWFGAHTLHSSTQSVLRDRKVA